MLRNFGIKKNVYETSGVVKTAAVAAAATRLNFHLFN